MILRKHTLTEQVKEHILREIVSGRFSPGGRLTSVRALSRELRVSHVCAARAVAELVRDGVLTAKNGSGTFLSGRLPHELKPEGRPGTLRKLYVFHQHQQSSSGYHKEVLNRLMEAAKTRSWQIQARLFTPAAYENALADPDLEGIVLGTVPKNAAYPAGRVVHYGMEPYPDGIPSVTPDNYAAGCSAARLLLEKGWRNLFFISGFSRTGSAGTLRNLNFIERYRGLNDTYRMTNPHDVPLLYWSIDNPCREDVTALIRRIGNREFREYPVFVVGNRIMACEIHSFISKHRLRVPGDIGLLSFIRRGSTDMRVPIDTLDFEHSQFAEQLTAFFDAWDRGLGVPSRVLLPMHYLPEGSLPG